MTQIKAKMISIILISAALTLFLYIILHESGHMIVMLSAGARITEFSILGAHVSGEGGSYTNISDLGLHANGAFLPLLISYVYLLLYRSGSENSFYRTFSCFFGLIPAISMIAWIIIPFTFISGNAPLNDDVTLFLENFSHDFSPLAVSAAAALFMGIGIAIIIRKKVLRNFMEEIKRVRDECISASGTDR